MPDSKVSWNLAKILLLPTREQYHIFFREDSIQKDIIKAVRAFGVFGLNTNL